MSLTKKTISAGISRIISLVSKGLLQLGVLIFFARFLSQGEFGIINIVTSLLAFITLFTEIGLGPALIQKQELTDKHLQVASFGSLLFALVTYALLFIAAPFIADFYHTPLLKDVLRVVGIAFVFTSLGNVSFSLLRKELDFQSILVVELSAFVIGYCVVGAYLAYIGWGVWSYAIAIVAQSVVMCMLLWLKKPQRIFQWHKEEFGHLFQFAGWLTVENVLNMLARQSDIFITGRVLGMSAVGLYGRAYQLLDIPNQYVGMALDNVLFPAMAQRQHDRQSIAQSFLRGISIVNLALFPMAVFLALQSDNIILLLFGEEWLPASPVLQLLCLTLPLKTSVKLVDSMVRALGAFRQSARLKLLFLLCMCVCALTGSKWGLLGVAMGVNLAVLINYVCMTSLAWKLSRFKLLNYAATYYPGALLAILTLLLHLLSSFLLSGHASHPGIALLLCGILTGSGCFLLLLLFPPLFGENWKWILTQMLGYIPPNNKLSKLRNFLEWRMIGGVE